ncbi:MAG: NADH-quinone oxidoreductase subunit L, partial [Verrucomicrobiaceae bacterium]
MSHAEIILFLPLVTAAAILLGLKRSATVSALLSTASVLVTFLLSIGLLLKGQDSTELIGSWIRIGDAFSIDITLKLDALSRGMMIVVTTIGLLVHIFSLGYMKGDPGKARYFAGLSLFLFSMTGIVYSDNFPMMFIFWELVGVSSYILIGHWYTKNSAADAAKKAFLTNRIGDFGFMIGILLLWAATKQFSFDGVKAGVESGMITGGLLTAATLCIFCGTIGKSAQFPLHVWLPDAMEGPTPVSALIHAATMVAAGVYLMVRVAFLIAASAAAGTVVAWIGGLTALMAALMATQQNDIKRVLAYSTLSQLGYMVMAVGLGAAQASMFHLFTHAFFKALLFLGSGAVIYACHHEQNIWKMGGLRSKMPITFLTFAIGTAALMAVPFVTSGFYSKEAILEAALEHKSYLLFLIGVGTAFLTAFYMTRLVVVAFFGKPRDHGADHAHEVPLTMLVPLIILAVPSIIAGFHFFGGKVLGEYMPHHEGSMIGLTFFASLLTLVGGVYFGWKTYIGKDSDPLSIKVFANKFYFDEFYAKLIAALQDAPARALQLIDNLLIDGLAVRGGSALASGTGSLLRRLQV